MSPLPYPSLTFCIFLIAHGCVLFIRLGDWAEREQGRSYKEGKKKVRHVLSSSLQYFYFSLFPLPFSLFPLPS